MKIIRTFHPVGQGAFYSERFYEDNNPKPVCNIVYDCGTSWGTISKAKKVVTLAFDKDDTINYLFISHLDYDHVSLVNTLIESVGGSVDNIVLPLVNRDEVIIGMNLNFISNHRETGDFLRNILVYMYGGNIWPETRIGFIGGDDNNSRFVNVGRTINLKFEKDELEWVLIPRNVSAWSRRDDLLNNLDKMLADTDFLEESELCDLPPVRSGEDLLERLLDENYVRGVLRNNKLRNAIKSAYERVAGGTNENSLLLYSGPADDDSDYAFYPSLLQRYIGCKRRRVGCLYTGDSDCEIDEWKKELYHDVWGNIGTIQLPHHGSLKSFDVKKNNIDEVYYFPVSCGSTNMFGHPSGKVLSYLLARDGRPQIVTEEVNTMYMQKIVI